MTKRRQGDIDPPITFEASSSPAEALGINDANQPNFVGTAGLRRDGFAASISEGEIRSRNGHAQAAKAERGAPHGRPRLHSM